MGDFDDLLGPEPELEHDEPPEPEMPAAPPRRRRGRPRKGEARPAPAKEERKAEGQTSGEVVQALHRPVSITFLSQAMDMDRKNVTKKLSALTPISYHRGNVPLYDFRQAMQYLVAPKVDVAAYVRKMGVGDLPAALQKDVWDARLKEQKWRQNAGELWPTDAVLDVLGEAFKRLKTTAQLWIDQIAESQALPAEVRQELTERVDALQADLHRALVEMPRERATESQLAEIDPDEGVV